MRYRLMTYTRRCVCASRERNQMVFILKYEKKEGRGERGKKSSKKSKIESCSFAILYTQKKYNENNFVDDNRLFFLLSDENFFLHLFKIDI